MAKQIILTQNNFGIPIELQFMSNTNSPIDLTGKTVEVAISYDGTIVDVLQATISSYTNGTAYIVTTTRHTSNVGLYTTFWSVRDEYGYITAQEDLYYYVKGEYNGAENNGIEQDKGTILEKVDKINSSIEILNEENSVISTRVSGIEIINSQLTNNIETINSQLDNIKTNHLDVNIRDFGAKCDGITDDTEAIKRAINRIKENNGKSSLDLSFGTILISENILIPPLVKIYGRGIYKTTIKAKEGVSIILDITSDGIYNNEFYDFTIDGNNNSNIKGIYFNEKNATINDENCKFENILIVNCTDPLIIGSNNRGNRFDNINIEHCVNGLILNGTDNLLNNITISSITNNGIEINGSNNHLSMCKVFYSNKVGCIVNGNINVIDIEVQENGLNGIEINGYLNNVNILADTNGRISPSHNIKIDGYKNIINGVCSYNSYLDGNINSHINILNGTINELNMICHGNKPYIAEGCISPSNKILINNKSLVTNIVNEGMEFEHFGAGTSSQSFNYLYNAPSFYNVNAGTNGGCYYKKEIDIAGNNKYSAYLKAIVKGGACKLILSFYNSDSLIKEISSEELNTSHNNDSIVFLNGNFPSNTKKVVFNIKTYATSQDGYSESIIIDYGFTMF